MSDDWARLEQEAEDRLQKSYEDRMRKLGRPIPSATPEEAFAKLMKAQGARTSQAEEALQAMLADRLPGANVRLGRGAENISSAATGSLADQLAFWRQRFPKTVGGFELLEPTIDAGSLAHHRALGGKSLMGSPAFAMGIPESTTLGSLGASSIDNQRIGYLASRPGIPAIQNLWNHEFGHALDYTLDDYLRPGLNEPGLRGQAAVKLNSLKAQLIEDALAGRISGYSKAFAEKQLPNALANMAPMGTNVFDLPQYRTAADLRSNLHPRTINSIAKEPFAEAFTRNPAMLNEVEAAARGAGWVGSARPGTMLKGAGIGAALLAAPILGDLIGQKLGGRAGKAVQWGAQGAGIGGMLGAPGALAGAGIGALASQLLG